MHGKQIEEHGENCGSVFETKPVLDSHKQTLSNGNDDSKYNSNSLKSNIARETNKITNNAEANKESLRVKPYLNINNSSRSDENPPMINKLSTYEQRLSNYNKIRERIFHDFKPKMNKKISKTRDRYHNRKTERKEIASTRLESNTDIRPYMDIDLNGVSLKGLMDSGASISCLGKDCLENVKKMGCKILDFKSSIRTADGNGHQIIGKVNVVAKVGLEDKDLLLYLVPNLQQELILGYDFWKLIGIQICTENRLINEIAQDTEENTKIHRLSTQQLQILEEVKSYFRCYTKYGLGKTNLETHVIETGEAAPKKMRYKN